MDFIQNLLTECKRNKVVEKFEVREVKLESLCFARERRNEERVEVKCQCVEREILAWKQT